MQEGKHTGWVTYRLDGMASRVCVGSYPDAGNPAYRFDSHVFRGLAGLWGGSNLVRQGWGTDRPCIEPV